MCAILGPSGAGKSSLLNVLAGRSASTSTISVDGIVSFLNDDAVIVILADVFCYLSLLFRYEWAIS